ncbi:beta-aspartyl-peptidase [Clostridium manihotivorum]|uniref:Isoaspartyl dipeptidase n=1 Tax=Clostridium manihotivorum TaxID=2320868 RepID=A0A3R5QRS7_9CLOT|nr:beta-aspartyl-peptidase [Clostridium manihotivorum]QAA30887.1 beta-aspartyl-peptidase [Clostridium manihotivorum]
MITVIKNVDVYSPKHLGIKDVVMVGDKIEGVYDSITIPTDFVNIAVIDGNGKVLVPGFMDCHVHIMGGGGEGGFKTRTPELPFSEIVKAGITTLVGCVGTDDVCRNMVSLLAKAHALEEEGITTYCYTGSYQIPVKTVTQNIKGDLMLLDKVIGVGEVAISDHRSSQPTYDQFANVVAEARVGGLLSGKAGVVNIHLGDGTRKLDYLFKLIEQTEIHPHQLLPTHVNRNGELFKDGIRYVQKGGFIDLTTSFDPKNMAAGEVSPSKGLKIALDQGVPDDHITFSSDGNGSLPLFNDETRTTEVGMCLVSSLYNEVRNAVIEEKVPMERAIKVITSNVADILKLPYKGRVEAGKDADLVLLDRDKLEVDTVIAKGKVLMQDKNILVKGTFEK